MKIPKEDAVKFVVKAVLRKRNAGSQGELTSLVNKELKKVDPEYTISGKRLRTITISMPEARLKTSVKKGKTPRRCPSCNSILKKHYTKNLKGKKVLEHMKCLKCSYKGHDGKWLPSKYEFRFSK
jgi:uncharacterized protein with PIN domain